MESEMAWRREQAVCNDNPRISCAMGLSAPPGKELMHIVVIGYGNPYRGDEAAGLVLAGIVPRYLPNFADIRSITADGTALLDAWRGADALILVDSVQSGSTPGTVHRFRNLKDLASGFRFASCHTFGLVEAVTLAATLRLIPARVIVYGIEAAQFDESAGLSNEVAEAVLRTASEIQTDFHALLNGALRDISDG